MMTYTEQLKDPRWQKKRLEIFERDKWTCCNCSESTITLNVHHAFYFSKIQAWEYPNYSLFTLCENCHKEISKESKEIDREIVWRFLGGLKDSFIKQCAVEVLRKYNVNDFIYKLWEDQMFHPKKDEINIRDLANLYDGR